MVRYCHNTFVLTIGPVARPQLVQLLSVLSMKLIAIIGLFALLFPAATHYCFQRRGISSRPGAFYLLVVVVGCGVLLISTLTVEGARVVRNSITSAYSGTGDLLDHTNGDPSGTRLVAVQSTEFPKPTGQDEEAWRSWQQRLRDYLIREVYELDFSSSAEPRLDARPLREITEAGLIRKEFAILAADGDLIPAVALLPAGASAPLPGILILHGHVLDGDSGLAQMVLPVKSYQRSAARELALAGFATLTIELRGFGMRGPPEFPDHRIVSYNAILAGSFYKKIVFGDIKRTMDFFATLPGIDPERLGISGLSLGAELAVEYAALDERIKAISFHAHGGRTGPYPAKLDPRSEQPHYCHLIPNANRIMHREDPFLLLAPRPTQGVRGQQDPFAEAKFELTLQRAWSLMGRAEALELRLVTGSAGDRAHTYFVEDAIRFFKRQL